MSSSSEDEFWEAAQTNAASPTNFKSTHGSAMNKTLDHFRHVSKKEIAEIEESVIQESKAATKNTLQYLKEQHKQRFQELSRDYELLKRLIAKRANSIRQARGILQTLHLYKTQIKLSREKRRQTLKMSYDDITALEEELTELKRRREVCRTMIFNLKEEMVFANLRSKELVAEIEELKVQHAQHMNEAYEDLERQREKWRTAEDIVNSVCCDYKLKASQTASKLEGQQKENERALAQIKHEIEIAQGLVRGNSRSFTFYGTLKEFIAAGIESTSNSRSASVTTRIKTAFVRSIAPKADKIPSIKLNSSFSIRSGAVS
mmetsp:Transcript_18390/g.33074  ORF Transcript_18390/g.33074 Transcript_18390/m.33074 type:complete len:318 (-) Transcript_18390:51-1004(-)